VSGYHKITVSYVSGTMFTNGDLVAVSFSRTGDNGAQGTTGTATQGAAGTSVQGATGTATQGATGTATQGATGTATQGATGTATQGIQGITGTATQGATGTATQGTTGAQGTTGTATQGATGTATQGTTGAQGITGTGTQGIQGITGTGTQGIQGITGTGTQGTTGVQGIAGGGGSIPGSNNEVLTSDGAGGATAESNLRFTGNTLTTDSADNSLTRALVVRNSDSGSDAGAIIDFKTTDNDPFSIGQFNQIFSVYNAGDVVLQNTSTNGNIYIGANGNTNRISISSNNDVGIGYAVGTTVAGVALGVGGSVDIINDLYVGNSGAFYI
jgi:hypothetical protein